MQIKGGNLPGTYKALQLHFHWGGDGGPGSEHTVDGERYPMEVTLRPPSKKSSEKVQCGPAFLLQMHLVHIKEQYRSLSRAVSDPAGVAVLGFFFQVIRHNNRCRPIDPDPSDRCRSVPR